MLRREDILGAADIVIEKLYIPEWFGDVYVKSMNGTERQACDAIILKNRPDVLATIAAFSIVDEQGERLFSPTDIVALAKKSSYALERIWDWHKAHSGIGAKALEESLKNSEPGQNGAGSSATSAASAG